MTDTRKTVATIAAAAMTQREVLHLLTAAAETHLKGTAGAKRDLEVAVEIAKAALVKVDAP